MKDKDHVNKSKLPKKTENLKRLLKRRGLEGEHKLELASSDLHVNLRGKSKEVVENEEG